MIPTRSRTTATSCANSIAPHGYDDVHVAESSSYDVEKGGVVVVFKIDEGPQYRFGKVDIESSLKTVDAAELSQDLRTQGGELTTPTPWKDRRRTRDRTRQKWQAVRQCVGAQ